ncbi:hypothetical protein P691DRAFT_679420 [Macrolepiota fuliginosa MF-IS2]|uniref:Uncharacterized protein n=1 Tax=Macrolepiota fuliginosa MF-IS2 TaxID=1400762 RepID=A0A9P5X617_9AGAR|nr:hypothetical protein P691DRAFT_679420 [Macrolepiota fuliginosa MF-IS2]
MSSIPGLGLAAGVAVSPQSVGSWMDSMGKKLGQLQRSSTFTKNQKRASLLLADMSQSIVSVLAPPSSVAPGTNGSKLPTHLTAPSISPNSSVAGSLLDDEDDETVKIGAAVLQPVASPSVAAKERMTKGKVGKEKEDDDEEEWNW